MHLLVGLIEKKSIYIPLSFIFDVHVREIVRSSKWLASPQHELWTLQLSP